MKNLITYTAIAATLLFTACQEGRDFYVVLDTSGSMAGGTLEKVKKSMPNLVREMKEGDQVTLLRFADKVEDEYSVEIESEADKQKILDWTASLEPTGKHTNMHDMIVRLREKIQAGPESDRKQFVIVMSDGKDDPPPEGKALSGGLESYRAKGVEVKQPYIYYISLGDQPDPALETELAGMSEDVETVDRSKEAASGPGNGNTPGTDSGTGDPGTDNTGKDGPGHKDENTGEGADGSDPLGLSEVSENIDQKSGFNLDWLKENWILIAAIVAGILLLLLLLYLIFGRASGGKLNGELSFYEASTHPSLARTVRLDRMGGSKLTIGSASANKIRIRDLDASGPFSLKGAVKKGRSVLKPSGKAGGLKFLKQDQSGIVSPGDRFQIGNYIFEYKDGNKKG